MKMEFWYVLTFLVLSAALNGCQQSQPHPAASHSHHDHGAATAGESLAKLTPADRKLAVAQGFCAKETDTELGSMGVPVKVVVNGQPIFVCCESCTPDVLRNPQQTLAMVDKLKAKVRAAAK